jgi:hypothetical protein
MEVARMHPMTRARYTVDERRGEDALSGGDEPEEEQQAASRERRHCGGDERDFLYRCRSRKRGREIEIEPPMAAVPSLGQRRRKPLLHPARPTTPP